MLALAEPLRSEEMSLNHSAKLSGNHAMLYGSLFVKNWSKLELLLPRDGLEKIGEGRYVLNRDNVCTLLVLPLIIAVN